MAALGCFHIRGAQIVAVRVKWARGAPTTIDELFDRGQRLEMSTQSRMIARWYSSRISSNDGSFRVCAASVLMGHASEAWGWKMLCKKFNHRNKIGSSEMVHL